jgi:hypothetical protein
MEVTGLKAIDLCSANCKNFVFIENKAIDGGRMLHPAMLLPARWYFAKLPYESDAILMASCEPS